MSFHAVSKQCAHCGAPLKLRNSRDIDRKRFCSRACRQRWRYEHGDSPFDQVRHLSYLPENVAKRFVPKGPIACHHCKATFQPDSSRQRFCKTCVPDKASRTRLGRYGISHPEWMAMYDKQGGKCALCDSTPTTVDHCHATGKVRGLLCDYCNVSLAQIENGWHLRALAYLERS